jgi:hypothetical protein
MDINLGQCPKDLFDLEQCLKGLSHRSDALQIIRDFSSSLGKTKERQVVFNETGALVRAPIFCDKTSFKEDREFILLQGDIVQTNSAYFLGERLEGSKFIIASSTCDLMPERRVYSSLFRITPLRKYDPNIKQVLGELLSFKSTWRMYIPPLANDPEDVIGNAIVLDGIVQIRLSDLLLATRCASLSLVGWRIFGSLMRDLLVRAGDDEVSIRSSLTVLSEAN